MKNHEYADLFKKLNIPIAPMPSNYTPETYAQELMRGCYSEQGVSYSATTVLNRGTEETENRN